MNKKIFEDVDGYVADLFNANETWMPEVLRQCEQDGIPNWSISANQGRLLQILCRLNGAKKILELGTQGGYSAIWLAKALPQGGRVITLEIDQRFADTAIKNFRQTGVDGKVEVRVGRALDVLPTLKTEGPFDMIFLDADKPPYAEYLEWAIKLSHPGSLIVADNVVREGKVLDPDSTDEAVKGVQRFNNKLAADARVTATIFQSIGSKDHDGMAIAIVN